MKKFYFILSFFILSICCFAQYPNGVQTIGTDSNLVKARGGFQGRFININYADTTAANLERIRQYPGAQIYTSSDNLIWIRNSSSTAWLKVGSNSLIPSNGNILIGDSIQQGGTIIKATHIQIENHQITGSPYTYLHYANKPAAQTIIQDLNPYPTVTIYNPTTIAAEALYEEKDGDTAYLHYGGRFVSVVRNMFDSTSTRFAAGNKSILLPSNGFEGVYQFMIPRDSTVWGVGGDGQSSGVIHAQWDLGNTYGYNTNVVPGFNVPGFPLVTILSSIDLMRNIDNTRRHKMTGAGVAGFMSKYKSYQSAINMSTYEAGNITDSIFGYKAYGDHNPLISGATKAKTLAVWDVKHAFAFFSEPQYRYTNTVRDGYAFVAKGDSDFSHLPFLNIGPYSTLPERANGGNSSFADRLYVTGNGKFTGNTYAFVTQAQGFIASTDIAVGTEAGMNFKQTDSSSIVATFGAYLFPSNRNLRGGYWRSEMFTGAVMDNNQTGGFLQLETGVNHTNITKQWRNGNFFIGYTTAMDSFRLYKKLAVQGSTVLTDTLTIKNVITRVVDSTNLKPLVIDANGNVYKSYWGNAGTGGGAGTVTAVSAGYGTTFSTITTTGSVVVDTTATITSQYRSMKIVDSMISVNNLRYWSLSGNTATAGSQAGSFIGPTNQIAFRFRTNNTQRMYIDSTKAQVILGAPTIDNVNAMVIQGLTNTNTDGIKLYANNLTVPLTIGWGIFAPSGNYNFTNATGALSFTPSTGVIIGSSAHTTSATALLQLSAGTTSKSPMKFTSGSLTTGGNILAGNVEFLTDKWYGTISTGPAQKEFTMNDAALTSGTTPVATTNGRLTDGVILTSGSWTPTITGTSNVASSSSPIGYYTRVGNRVNYSIYVNITPTAGTTNTVFTATIPIASNFVSVTELQGAGSGNDGTTYIPAIVQADATADAASVKFTSVSTGSHTIGISGIYIIQ